MGTDRPGGTDTRAENVEKPPAEDRPPAPPPDRPGSPGQPSRLESLRAAREAQEARRAETGTQQTAPQETDAEQREEREENKGESSPAKSADEGQDARTEPTTPEGTSVDGETGPGTDEGSGERDQETDRPESETGQARLDGHGEQPYAAGAGELAPETGTEPRGEVRDDDKTADEPAGEKPDAPAEPQNAEDQPMIEEPATESGEADPESPGERDQVEVRGAAAEALQSQDHQPLPQRDAHTERQPPAGEPVREANTPEPGDEPTIRVAWLTESEEGVTRWASPVVQFNDRSPGTQVEDRGSNGRDQSGTPATTDDEPNKYRRLPEVPREGTPGRGEVIPPEEDPEQRDYLEPDPDTTRRRDRIGRRFARSTPDTVDVGKKWTDDIDKFLNDKPPGPTTTGTGKDIPNNPVTPHQKMTVGDGTVGVALAAILLFKGAQRLHSTVEDKLKGHTGRRDGGNG
ncbi:hypothetical protein [Actinomadura sp. 7K534]|uniref:hypothetical protein n=1 Tax=Actinomadura sp. 7K534 TaxID=2530366 RepID=UPI0010488F78|nr:hypothetical protein [Actinomadura sp. 7K534]TDB88709.1 hypothetical protein E1266_30850 [Actinomadura sp. 7K534]